MNAPLLQADQLCSGPVQNLSFAWPAGVSWVCGDEGAGKTTLLRLLAGHVTPEAGSVHAAPGGVFGIDLPIPVDDSTTVQACWDALRLHHPRWNDALLHDLSQALDMQVHSHKPLYMLSTGSRRKVMVLAALASGASVTLLDQPFAAMDGASIRVLKEFLSEAATHPHRAWIVADYEAPRDLTLTTVLQL